MNNVGFKRCDFSGLPEEVRRGIDEYCRLWDLGFKKQANAELGRAMAALDAAPETALARFAEGICTAYCSGRGGPDAGLPYWVRTRLERYLAPFAETGTLPQARWHCALFGDYDQARALFARNRDDAQCALLLFSYLVGFLSLAGHELPLGCLCNQGEFDEACRLAEEIMGAFPVPEELIKSYAFCRAPLEAYFSAEGGASCLN